MRWGCGCHPHNAHSALRDHRHELLGKLPFFIVIISVRLLDILDKCAEEQNCRPLPLNSEMTKSLS